MHKILVVFLVATALAGCSETASPPEDDGFNAIDVETSDTLGAISGVVVSETIVPIAGAAVLLVSHDTETVTDEEGRFVFEDLDPGVYFVSVEAPAFAGVQTSVEVAAGEVAKPRILLAADSSPQPYHATLQHNGFMQAWLTIASFVLVVVAPESSGCDCEMIFTPDGNASTYIYEVTYEEALESPAGHGGYYWELLEEEPDLHIESGFANDPIYQRIEADVYSPNPVMNARLTGPDEWVAIDQAFQMFVTVFYLDDAPEGWTVFQS